MTSVIPKSSDTFKLMCAQAANRIDYNPKRLLREVDALQKYAMDHGLVAKLGQDFIQRLMSEAIRPVRRWRR
jgi:hypothetical protein